MSTRQQRDDFTDTLIASDLLDTAIEWIKTNMNPEDVFDDEALTTWARENDMRTREETASTYSPEDVFDQHELRNWAESNGYAEEQ